MTKPSNTFMPFYVSDYLADTTMLTRDQHGAYLLLIMTYWRNRGPIHDDDDSMAIIIKANQVEWKRLRPIMARFFIVENGTWTHKRIDEELKKSDEKYNTRVAASRKANGVRYGHRHGVPNGVPNGVQTESDCPPNQNHTPTEECFNSIPSDRRRRASAHGKHAATPVGPTEDWGDKTEEWRKFKALISSGEWVSWFSVCSTNGANSTLIAPTAFTAEQIEAKYGQRLVAHFGEDFELKVKQ